MELTERKFLLYKRILTVSPMQKRTDEYGHVEESYGEPYELDTPVMITPEKQDEEHPKPYGIHDVSRFEFVYYGTKTLHPLDRISDGETTYTVVKVTPYQTHKVVLMEENTWPTN